MAKNFKECELTGGKMVIKRLKGGKTLKICYDKEGNSFASKVFKQEEVASLNLNKQASTSSEEQGTSLYQPATIESLEKLKEYFKGL